MSKAKILYIDDEVDLLDLAASFFEDENLPVDTCSDFHEALALIKNNSYEVIISDANMPSGSGIDLYKLIRDEKLFTGKFILATGKVETSQEYSKLGIDHIIYKPIKFMDLIDEVKKLIS